MKNQNIRRLLIAGTLLFTGASLASANSVTYYIDVFNSSPAATQTLPAGCTALTLPTCLSTHTGDVTQAGPSATATISIPLFNQLASNVNGYPTLPTGYVWALSAVNLTLDWVTNGGLTVYNFSGTNQNFTGGNAEIPLQLTAAGVSTTVFTQTQNQSGTVPSGIPYGSVSFSNLSGVGSSSASVPTSDFYAYEGASGTFNASVTGQGQECGTNPSLPCMGNSTAGAILAVSYTFSAVAVPEPVTMVLTGSSLMGLAFFLRRKRAKA